MAYKIEIEAAQETYRVAKTENEKLKEVNEIQHKLWKIFVNKFELMGGEFFLKVREENNITPAKWRAALMMIQMGAEIR